MTKPLTTRNLNPAPDCQICGDCPRCNQYHALRHEVTRLRKLLRRILKAANEGAR